jgi:hypothetical protein
MRKMAFFSSCSTSEYSLLPIPLPWVNRCFCKPPSRDNSMISLWSVCGTIFLDIAQRSINAPKLRPASVAFWRMASRSSGKHLTGGSVAVRFLFSLLLIFFDARLSNLMRSFPIPGCRGSALTRSLCIADTVVAVIQSISCPVLNICKLEYTALTWICHGVEENERQGMTGIL